MDFLAAIHANRRSMPRHDLAPIVVGHLLEPPDADGLCTISVNGSDALPGVPATPAVYTGVNTVRVLMDGDLPLHVVGPAGTIVTGPEADHAPPPIGPPPSAGVTRTILPRDSGTYRVDRGAWDRWGTAADIYQGSGSGSGRLWGLAAYGDQLTAIGAAEFTRVQLVIPQATHTGSSGNWTATVRGSAAGSLPSGAPSYTGDTATLTMPGRSVPGVRTVDLPASIREGLRTGAVRSLGLVGTPYGVTLGVGRHPQAWALIVDARLT